MYSTDRPFRGRGVTGFCILALLVRTLAALTGFFAGAASLGNFFALGFVSFEELGMSPRRTLYASSTWYDTVEVIDDSALRYAKRLSQR
jgi:hypothetical protein